MKELITASGIPPVSTDEDQSSFENWKLNWNRALSQLEGNNVLSEKPSAVKTVNKNAYEIRLEVLQEAIKWLSLEINAPTVNQNPQFRNGDSVIDLAQKFYKFVENRH